jgi:hypothetical protein
MAHTHPLMRLDRRSLALIAGIGLLVCADAESAPERYRVQATLTSANVAQSADGRMGLSASLTAPRAQALGSGYSIVASISSPMTCTSDTIFENGFDP